MKKKILYGINGTGSGHITRARELIPYLEKKYDVDILISGCNYIINTKLKIKYQFKGFTFVINNNGQVSYLRSFFGNNLMSFFFDVYKLDLNEYDFIISDFEPITAWAGKFKNKSTLQMSHQSSLFSIKSPRPQKIDRLAEFFIRWYSPCDKYIGFHFDEYGENIYKPLLRQKILDAKPSIGNYYVVYLWNYSIKFMVNIFSEFSNYEFKIFVSNINEKKLIGNCEIFPTSDDVFFQAILNCKGVICGAGFELPAEVMYLKKELYVIPIGNQYEQQCNAQALIEMGVDSCLTLNKEGLGEWLNNTNKDYKGIEVSDPDKIIEAIDM